MPKSITRSVNYNRRVDFVRGKNYQQIQEIRILLDQQSHLFIVTLGAVIGTILSIFIAYHLKPNLFEYAMLSVIPFALSYSLRKVYIHTLVHSQE